MRFEELMKFAKKDEGNIPFRSGEDDEAPPNEMQSGLEDICKDVTITSSAQSDLV